MASACIPRFLKLTGRRVVLVGGGRVAAAKLEGLLARARTSPSSRRRFDRARAARRDDRARRFEDAISTGPGGSVAAHRRGEPAGAGRAERRRRVFVNAVDDPRTPRPMLGGVVRRAGVTVAISTDGRAPALAGLLREALDAWLPADLDDVDGGRG